MASTSVTGNLLMYGDDPSRQMAVFMTGNHDRAFVVVGGQINNFFSLPSMRQLVNELGGSGWTTAQVQLASSLVGYGGRTHVGDAEDLRDFIGSLEREFNMKEVTLFAWSSGVQVALEYLASSENAEIVTRVILQGVVNNPKDSMYMPAGVTLRREVVETMLADGRKEQIVPVEIYDVPLSAARLSTGGLPTIQEAIWQPAISGDRAALTANLACIKVPLFLMIAVSTEYLPTAADKETVRSALHACAATPELEVSFFDGAGDERRRMLRGSESVHTAAIAFFLGECDRKRSEREEHAKQLAAEEMRRSRSILAKSMLKGA